MGCDENDFQSQNFQLAGEDNKFPSSLQSFSLPKFDLDEHLRFESLVEAEHLLGIQSQGSTWIDFSPGSGAIEFSSSAAESCSISRRNNVWSEATSSESVEMLLKSVGEDEMIKNKDVIMEVSANDVSYSMDNQVDFYVKEDDTNNSTIVETLPGHQDLVQDKRHENLLGVSENSKDFLPHLQCSSQGACTSPSNGKFSSSAKITTGDQSMEDEKVTYLYPIEKSSAADQILHEPDSYESKLCDALTTTVPHIGDSMMVFQNSESFISRSNQIAERIMVSHNSETRLCSDGGHEGDTEGRSGLRSDDSQSEKSLLMVRENKANSQFLDNSDALVVLNNKCGGYVSSDGILLTISNKSKTLKDNVRDYEISGKLEDKRRFAKKHKAYISGSTSDICSTSTAELSNSAEGCNRVSCIQPHNSMGDDLHEGTSEAFQSSVCHNRSGNPDSSKNAIDGNLQPDAEIVISSNADVGNATRVLNEPRALIHVAENQAIEIVKRNNYVVACNVTGKINADRPDVKPDAANDISKDECSLSFAKSDVEAKTSDSVSFRAHMHAAGMPATGSSEVHIPRLDASESKYSSLPCINQDGVNLDKVSNAIDKVDDLIRTNCHVTEDLSLFAKKLVQEELDSDPVLLDFEKSAYLHLTPHEDATNSDEFKKQKEPIGVSVSASDTNYSDEKDLLFSGDPASSLPTNNLVSVKASSKLASPDETLNSQLSQKIAGINLAIEQKEQSCSGGPDENRIQLSGRPRLSNSKINIEMEMVKGTSASSHCVEESLLNNQSECHQHTVLQPSPSVQRVDPSSCGSEIPCSLGNTVGNGSSSHGSSIDGKDMTIFSLETFSHMRTDSSIASDNTSKEYGIESSKAGTWIASPSNLEAQSGNPSSSAHDSDSPTVIVCNECPRDDPKKQEPSESPVNCDLGATSDKTLVSSAKDGFSHSVESSHHDLKRMVTKDEDGSFTIVVSKSENFPEKVANHEWKPFPSLQSLDISQMPKGDAQGCLEERKETDIPTITPVGGNSRNVSRISNEKKNGSRGKSKKEASVPIKSCGMDVKYLGATPKSSGTSSKDRQLVEIPEFFSVECNTAKKLSSSSVQTSCIPDLNSSSSLAYFNQPFTDAQQIQLRAQIFVYGALISGMPPDEACLTSAFGDTENGRTLWESLWRASVARLQNQNSPISGVETPLFRPVSREKDVQNKEQTTNVTKSSSIMDSTDVLSSRVSLPSPVWNTSSDGHTDFARGKLLDFSQAPFPLHPQSQSRQYIGINSPWLTQSPRPGPWFISSQNSALAETVHVTPLRDSGGSQAPTIQVVPPSVLMSTPGSTATTIIPALQTEMKRSTLARGSNKSTITTHTASTVIPALQTKMKKSTLACGNNKSTTVTHKARKRIKDLASAEPSLPLSQTLEEAGSASGVKNLQLPVSNMPLPSNPPVKALSESPVLSGSPRGSFPTHYQIIGGNNANQQKAIFSEETCKKIEQARLQAEDAAALAASTVKHSQSIWSQLAVQKNTGLVPDSDEKLASAAVAAALAASVAKAAAAAAKVASDAALNAKIMADESMSSVKSGSFAKNSETGMLDVGKKLGSLTPISILKSEDRLLGSGAVISAAREVARRRVESVSTAAKRAENLDALLKAAEFAAEAVAKAGTILAMGDPLPFTLGELVDAGPEGFWKTCQPASAQLLKPCLLHGEENALSSAKEHCRLAKQLDMPLPNKKEMHKTVGEGKLSPINEIHQQFEGEAEGAGNLTNTVLEGDHSFGYSSIQRGSIVEIMSDKDGLRGAWFSARVLDIKDNKAYVCFNDVSAEGELKEWIMLVSEGGKAPRIRTAPSSTSLKYEGTRKRRREHMGSYIWAVGDLVDAWMHDRWLEGTVAEMIPGDETKLTLHFPATGDKQAVHVWNLRPSLIWKDGQWIEWCHLRENSLKSPEEKRQRVGGIEVTTSSDVDNGVIGKHSKNVPIVESKNPKQGPLVLSAKDRIFSFGKNSKEQITSDALNTMRSGLQKEGSRVVIGVPKPGKRRKFIEVSKHYVAEKSQKINEGNDSIKFAKYLMPQTSRQLRSSSKVDTKGKKNGESKSSGGIKVDSLKDFQTSQAEKDNVLLTTKMETESHAIGQFPNDAEPTYVSAGESESSVQPAHTTALSMKKNVSRSETLKGKSTLDRTSRSESKMPENPGKAVSETTEPRRSNRRIQPTSRLLEGLQSSLIISKIPSIAHERKQHRGGSSSRGITHV
ncbi:hypothetical protein AXF42_Ash012584 [Apostasia shenzhenica]|uniref:QLQ domain-containing protein n=1 Tax=Apostasia shenzhenica TaxID=1088818 RepID=A0A2H9ZT31_9ASPA|nr:hypothetical protein AXF42_Ash012584 [Apostasia shenzhenica]